jgi:hypothetical protein
MHLACFSNAEANRLGLARVRPPRWPPSWIDAGSALVLGQSLLVRLGVWDGVSAIRHLLILAGCYGVQILSAFVRAFRTRTSSTGTDASTAS